MNRVCVRFKMLILRQFSRQYSTAVKNYSVLLTDLRTNFDDIYKKVSFSTGNNI